MEELFIGRQPIFDRRKQVYGYELLFRDGYHPNEAHFESDDDATATVVHNSMMGFTLDELVGGAKAFINFPEAFFDPRIDPCFSSHRIVCEVLETVPVNETTLAGIKKLRQKGFQIALDDFVFKKEFIPFIRLADIIKIDIEGVKPEKIPLLIERIRKVANTKILAERVETQAIYEVCRDAGCDYFQGYYFAKPEIVTSAKLSVSKLHLLMLLRKLAQENISLEDLEEVVSQDVGLMHKLIKLAAQNRTVGMPEFETLRQVMTLFGLRRVQSWASMISMNLLDDVVPEVFNIARTRAIFMRLCAEYEKLENPDSYYLAGMFSLLDVILKKPLLELLEALSLNRKIVNGILREEGEHGRMLQMVKSFEQSRSESLDQVYRHLYVRALKESHNAEALL
jgi:EAL and modified HD-GYP domain-containing signal transduction protein